MIEYLENVSDTEANEVCPDCQSCSDGCGCVCETCGASYEPDYDYEYEDDYCCSGCAASGADEDCC